jgi:hypothetical protein
VWSYSGNVVFFPGGTDRQASADLYRRRHPARSRWPRVPTGIRYDVDTAGTQMFIAENIGGASAFRGADAPNWGFRIDYRYLFINANEDAPAFFAKTTSRGAHRVYVGMLYTWKR